MEAIISQVIELAGAQNELGRKKIIDQLRDLSYTLESPDDVLHRVMYRHLEIAAVRIGCDLKLFDILVASETPLTLQQLQRATGAAPVLLGRILRYLSSVSLIAEPEKDTFASTNVTEALAEPGNQAGVHHFFDHVGPMYQELPDFLAKIKYQDIVDNNDTVFQEAYKNQGHAFEYMATHPHTAAYFNQYMAHRRRSMNTWLSVFPVEQETKGYDPNGVVFIDIGGNIGHQCAELKAKYPKLQGRVVLQDLPHAIGMALQTPGVENTIHDIFTPQPIKGAKFYYMRAVLHDFPDDKCREILKNIVPAMGKDSIILIDEMLLPDKNVHWHATEIDLTMMTALASIERTQSQWAALLDSVGLKITKTFTYTPSVYESVMVVEQK